MTCPAIASGPDFLPAVLGHIDCQARSLGAYGYGALSDPGSPVSIALTGLLVLFVGMFGMRLMLGYPGGRGDLAGAVLKVGIVLTLVSSWPAFRTVVYDTVVDGPAELTAAAGAGSDMSGSSSNLPERLAALDQAVIAVTSIGTGRLPGGDLRDEFRGYPLPDESGYGWGRVAFLLGVIAPFAIVRLGAGLLLAFTPLLAPWLLFERASGLFFGWVRALAFTVLGSVSVALLTSLEIALLEPWATAATAIRAGGAFLPSAPTELLVIALVFMAAQFGILGLLGRLTFFSGFGSRQVLAAWDRQASVEAAPAAMFQPLVLDDAPSSRARAISNSVATTMRREQMSRAGGGSGPASLASPQNVANDAVDPPTLGSSYRRGHRRSSASRRDQLR